MLVLERLRALDEIRDLLTALATDLLEVARAVLRGDCLATLLADATEELGAVLRGHETSTHAARLGHGHATTLSSCHGLLLSVTSKFGRLRAAQVSGWPTNGNDFATMCDQMSMRRRSRGQQAPRGRRGPR